MDVFYVKIDVFSDQICPWCYVGAVRLQEAVGRLDEKEFKVEIEWHPYLLRPKIPKDGIAIDISRSRSNDKEDLGNKKKASQVEMEAGKSGLKFTRNGNVPNTVDCHRLIHRVKVIKGLKAQNDLVNSLFKAFFVDGKNLSDANVLLECVSDNFDENGIEELRQYLLSNEDVELIKDEDAHAHNVMGITGVPLFVFNNRFQMPGAQDVQAFVNIFKRLKERNISFIPQPQSSL